MQQIEQTEQKLEQIIFGKQGRLKLVVASTVSSVATKLLASFKEQNPAMHISFDVTNREGLIEHGFVVREEGSGTRMAMERFFNDHDKALITNMEMNSNDAIKQAVGAGLGLGVVSIHTLEHELLENRLTMINAEGFPIRRSWFLVKRKDKHLSPLAGKFREYVLEQANQLPSLV